MAGRGIDREQYLGKLTHAPKYASVLLAFFILIAIAVIGFSFWNVHSMSVDSARNSSEYASQLTTQMAATVSTDQKDMKANLTGVAHTLGLFLSDGIEATASDTYLESYLGKAIEGSNFEYFHFHRTSGAIINAGDASADVIAAMHADDTDLMAEARKGDCVANVYNGHTMFITPVYQNNEFIGALVGGSNNESMTRLVSVDTYRQQTSFSMTNRKGDMLIASDNQAFATLKAYLENGSEISSALLNTVKADMEAGNANAHNVTLDGTDYVYAYAPIEGEDWMMLTLTPSDLFSGIYRRYVNIALACTLATAFAFINLLIFMRTRNKHASARLSQIAFEDTLTGGHNLADFDMRYEQLRQRGDVTRYSIVMLDIKDFKLVNEVSGFEAGDALLKAVAECIDAQLDKSRGEFGCRAEMDHFFVCMRETEPADIQRRIDAMVEAINKPLTGKSQQFTVEFGQGAVIILSPEVSASELQDCARVAKSSATGETLNRCAFYNEQMHKRIIEDRTLDHMAELSMENHDFKVFYQPKVSMHSGKVKGAEALVRWQHPRLGLISPAQFIPVLEESGRIQALDRYVFEDVCRWLSEREAAGKPMFPVSVNLSRMHFWKDNFIQDYVDIADKYQVNRNYIEFEITETAFMEDSKLVKVKEGIAEMHRNGFRCAVDDFGVGYSSLSLVHDMDVDVLKFDRSFFLDLQEEKSQKIVHCLINMANELQMGIVIEGIETQAQINFLKNESCDLIQGFYYSKPLPEATFDKWVDEHE